MTYSSTATKRVSNRFTQADIDRVKKFFNRERVFKQLKTMVSFLIPDRSNVALKLNIGGGSYTDGKSITVGLPEIFIKSSYEEIFIALQALTGHEAQHINSSDFEAYKAYQADVAETFVKKYPHMNAHILRNYMDKIAVAFGNGVEDGRIEKILGSKFPGYVDYLKFLNGSIWKAQEIKGNSELEDFLTSIVTYAVTGLNPKGFNKVYKGTELEKNLNKLKPMIIDGINAVSCRMCLSLCKDMIAAVEPYLVKLLEDRTQFDEEFLNSLPNQPEFTTSSEKDYNTSQSISVHFKPEKKKDEKKEEKKDEKSKKGKENKKEEQSSEGKMEGKEEKEEKGSKDSKDQKEKGSSDSQSEEENGEKDEEEEGESENSSGSSDNEEESNQEDGKGSSKGDESDEEEDNEGTSGGGSKEEDSDEETDSEDQDGQGSDSGEEEAGDESEEESDGSSTGKGDDDADDSEEDADGKSDGDSGDSESDAGDNSEKDSKGDSEKDGRLDSNENSDAGRDGDSEEAPDEQEPEMNDEELVRQAMDDVFKDIEKDVKDKISEESKDQKQTKKEKAEEECKLSQDDLREIEDHYKRDHIRKFHEVKGFPLRHALHEQIKREGKKFRKEVEAIFRNKEALTLRGQKRGVIDANSLYKVGVKDYNVFLKRGVPSTSDYVAYLLWDGSGSMSLNNKQMHSGFAVAVAEEGLKGIIPFKAAQFSVDNRNWVTHYVVKDFHENGKSYNYTYNFLHHRRADGGNKDGYSIRVATKELLKRPEKDRILIIFSDGLPSDYPSGKIGGYDIGMVDVKEAVKEARAKGIFVVSLLFGTESFRDANIEKYKFMYEKNIISCDPKDITNQLIRMLKKVISR